MRQRRDAMQNEAWSIWEAMAQMGEQPDRPEDFGWYDWMRAKEIGRAWHLHRILPHAGGWLDQTAADRHDMTLFELGALRAKWEHDEMNRPTKP